MTTYVSYFSSILSKIERTIKNLIVEDNLLPITSEVDREKCKDMNLDRVVFIGRPITARQIVTSIIGDDNYV